MGNLGIGSRLAAFYPGSGGKQSEQADTPAAQDERPAADADEDKADGAPDAQEAVGLLKKDDSLDLEQEDDKKDEDKK